MKAQLMAFLQNRRDRSLFVGFLALGLVAFVAPQFASNSTKEPPSADSFSADTVIPKGMVLVPIDIQNIESLHSLVGNFAVVDLFTTAQPPAQKGGVRVGQRLRLIRAPLNPNAFAVLVPEGEANEIMAAQGPFVAVIQNPSNQSPGEIVKKKTIVSGVEYFREGRHD